MGRDPGVAILVFRTVNAMQEMRRLEVGSRLILLLEAQAVLAGRQNCRTFEQPCEPRMGVEVFMIEKRGCLMTIAVEGAVDDTVERVTILQAGDLRLLPGGPRERRQKARDRLGVFLSWRYQEARA